MLRKPLTFILIQRNFDFIQKKAINLRTAKIISGCLAVFSVI